MWCILIAEMKTLSCRPHMSIAHTQSLPCT
jgi:hypothetical protein